MFYWGTTHLLGWIFGVLLLLNSGLIRVFDIVIYIGIPLAALISKIMRFKEFF
jgi:hypothetical protein